MQVEILSIPSTVRASDLQSLKVGDAFEIYRESVGGDSDNHWFTFGDKNQHEVNLDDLVVNGIEFKVIHEKAE
jgi:hypothetical protein